MKASDSPRILLIDEDEDHLRILTMLLKKNGFDVYSLTSHAGMLKAAKNFKPQVVIIDIQAGDSAGKEACLQLRDDENTKHLKVILHSAFPDVEKEYQACGADEFILKPVSIDRLISGINRHLERN